MADRPIVHGVARSLGMSTSRTGFELRVDFAASHLSVAAESAREAHRVEQANAGSEYGSWADRMIRLVPVCVILAGAALEANVNELIQDILDDRTLLSLTAARRIQLEDLRDERFGNAVDRYRRVALLFDRIPDKGSAGWQDTALLLQFRNHLLHFKPARYSSDIPEVELAKSLKKRVPLIPGWKGMQLLPHAFMSYGCGKWAVETALTFSREFTETLGIADRFPRSQWDLSLP